MDKLIIDPEFRDKIPPLTEEEFTLLEENILTDGAVFSPLIVWDNIILDGHNRYEIIQRHPELTYAVQKLPIDNRYEAIAWICKHQLGRRNLTPQQKKYLIGQRYDAEKMAQGGDRKSGDAISRGQIDLLISQGSTNNATRKKIAAESGTSDSYVKRADRFAKGVDAAEEVLPGIKQEILTGAIKPTETAVAAVAKAEPEERPRLAAALKTTKDGRGNKSKKSQPVYHKAPPVPSKRAEIQKIAEISAEMERPKEPSTEENIICSLDGEITSFMELFDHIFQEYPRLVSDERYRHEVIRILQRLKQYIVTIEGGYTV